MIIPIRCFTCGNVLADKELTYHALVEYYTQLTQTAHTTTPSSPNDPPPGATDQPNHTNRATTRTSELPFMDDVRALLDVPEDQMKSVQGKVLDELGVTKMCCRRHLLTGVDVLDDI
jgi:DNA-directed RNA polymerase subunit N (RpoN/RPB10)